MPHVQSVAWGADRVPSARSTPGASWPIRALLLFLTIAVASGMATGCRKAKSGEPKIPAVTVNHPNQEDVTDYVDFTGRTSAVEAVDVYCYPQVSGFMDRMQLPYTEGAMVQKGQVLFQIEPRPYQDQLAKSRAQDEANRASLNLAEVVLKNARDANQKVPGTISAQEIAQDEAAVLSAEANLQASKANTRISELNLSYTRVIAPISGQISRYYYTPGNLVTSQTKLTTIVSVDPMYVYFDVDEPTMLRINLVRDKQDKDLMKNNEDYRKRKQIAQAFPLLERMLVHDIILPVMISVPGNKGPLDPNDPSPGDKKSAPQDKKAGTRDKKADKADPDDDYWYEGSLNFVNNQVNSSTGSVSMRGVFPNAEPDILPGVKGSRLLKPGMFVRVRLPIGEKHPAILVDDKAIGSDQGKKFVWVVTKGKDKEGKEMDVAQKRMIVPGQLQKGGMREILNGLDGKPGVSTKDLVIVEGSLKAEEGKPVTPVEPKPKKSEQAMPATTTEQRSSPTGKQKAD